MMARDGDLVEERLRQCSLYDPTLDLAVEDADGSVAGYALFWFDQTTLVGLLEPMCGRKGARRLKVGFQTDAARSLYLGANFVQTSVDRLLIRPAQPEQVGSDAAGARREPRH